jgi:alpha-aminoadipic semialdehyde synthase
MVSRVCVWQPLQVVEVPKGQLMNFTEPVNFLPGFALEGYPNRDSIIYKDLYGIPEAKTVIRGSLRYVGYADTMQALVKLGMIDPNSNPAFHPKGPDMSWVWMTFLTSTALN